jgi:hypothetical protein
MDRKRNLARIATVGTVAVLILMMLLVTPVAAQEVIDEPIVIDPIDPNVDCDGDACFEVKNLQVWAVDPVTGEKVDNPSAGDTIKYSAEIHNTGNKRGEKYVNFNERKIDPDGGGGGGGALFKLDSGESKTFTQTQETTHGGRNTAGDGGTWRIQVYTGDGTTLPGDDSMDDLDSKNITLCCEPEASIESYKPENPNLGETVTFTGSGDDPDYRRSKGSRGPDLFLFWTVELSSATTGETCCGKGGTSGETSGETVNRTFYTVGEYTVELEVTDDDGQKTTTTTTVTVNSPPAAEFNAPAEPSPGEDVQFSATPSSDPDGSIEGYEWDFDGDGSFEASGKIVSKSFPTVGDRTVTLRVTDDNGASSTRSKVISVTNAPPTASFDY